MKKFLFVTLLAGAWVTLTTSCEDFLDAENKAAIEADSYFASEEGLDALRVSMYGGMKALVNNTDLTEWGTDLYIATRTSNVNDYHTYKITPETGGVVSFYQSVYSMINSANSMLKYGGDNPRYCAEAKFIRTWGYYHLTQHFGAVPYVTSYIETAEKFYPRTSLAELYPKLISELKTILEEGNLPESDLQGNISNRAVNVLLSKICLAAGWDLQTKITDEQKGDYEITGTDYFKLAASYADTAINGQPLTISFESKWSPYNEGNEEEIFSIQYERSGYPGDELTGGHGRQNTYGSQLGDPITSGLKSCSGVLAPSEKAIYLWNKDDERWAGTFMTTIYNYFGTWPTTGYYAYYTASASALNSMGITDKYFGWWTPVEEVEAYIKANSDKFVRGANNVGNPSRVHLVAGESVLWEFKDNGQLNKKITSAYMPYVKQYNAPTYTVKKFDDPNTVQQGVSTNCYRDIIVFHLSDVYLTAAEAYLMAGEKETALKYINDVRARAKAAKIESFDSYEPDYTVDASFGKIKEIDLLLDERARELFAETTRWVDLRRTHQLVRYNVAFNSEISSIADMSDVHGNVRWLRPIPAAEIATNTGMTEEDQNPGY